MQIKSQVTSRSEASASYALFFIIAVLVAVLAFIAGSYTGSMSPGYAVTKDRLERSNKDVADLQQQNTKSSDPNEKTALTDGCQNEIYDCQVKESNLKQQIIDLQKELADLNRKIQKNMDAKVEESKKQKLQNEPKIDIGSTNEGG